MPDGAIFLRRLIVLCYRRNNERTLMLTPTKPAPLDLVENCAKVRKIKDASDAESNALLCPLRKFGFSGSACQNSGSPWRATAEYYENKG